MRRLDTFLLDRVAQPIADRLVSPYNAAYVLLLGAAVIDITYAAVLTLDVGISIMLTIGTLCNLCLLRSQLRIARRLESIKRPIRNPVRARHGGLRLLLLIFLALWCSSLLLDAILPTTGALMVVPLIVLWSSGLYLLSCGRRTA